MRCSAPDRVVVGDRLVLIGSSGLHSNGYSLVRHVVLERAGWELDRDVPELGRTLGEELLEPTRVYAKHCLALIDAVETHAMAHVTGGGLAANLARVLPPGVVATIDRSTWTPHPVFGLVGALGDVPEAELERTLNMGVGMVADRARRRRRRCGGTAGRARTPGLGRWRRVSRDAPVGTARLVGAYR